VTVNLRLELLAGGFYPVALTGKRPIYPGWQSIVPTEAAIFTWRPGNTGLLTASTPAIDIDVLDDKVASQIEAMIFAITSSTLIRIGRAPKRALLFRTDVPFRKITSSWFVDDRDRRHRVEVLGQGQQLAAFGIHPDTGQPYEWRPHPPTQRADLPILTAAVAREIVTRATTTMERAGWKAIALGSINGSNPHHCSLLVATNNELPKPIYLALIRAMPLGSRVNRRHHRWAGSILRKLIAYSEGRNEALWRAAADFRPIVEQDLISAADAHALLVMACDANGYLAKDQLRQVNATILSGLKPREGGRGSGGQNRAGEQ